jgi:hypothetical protein
MYPDMLMVMQAQASSPPSIAFQPLGIDATAPVQFTVSAVPYTNNLIPLFAFGLTVTANATVRRHHAFSSVRSALGMLGMRARGVTGEGGRHHHLWRSG